MTENKDNDFVALTGFENEYEIQFDYPHVIRNKVNGKILKESIDSGGYLYVRLNQKNYRKHRLIARQFLDNSDNFPCVDHINRNRLDNRIDNLRWVTYSDNCKNKSSNKRIVYEYIDELPYEAIEINEYNNYKFEHYYYFNNTFYYYTGIEYRILPLLTNKRTGVVFICAKDINNKQISIFLNKFKKLYDVD